MFIVLIIEGSKLPMKSFISIWGVIKQGSGVVSLGAEQLFPNCLITRVPGRFAKCGVLSPTLEIWFSRWWGKGQGRRVWGGLRKFSSHCLLPDTKLCYLRWDCNTASVFRPEAILVRYRLASLLHLTIIVIFISWSHNANIPAIVESGAKACSVSATWFYFYLFIFVY